jgi:hypothetical protein
MNQEHITMQNIESTHASKFSKATLTEKSIIEEQLIVRINGTLPESETTRYRHGDM